MKQMIRLLTIYDFIYKVLVMKKLFYVILHDIKNDNFYYYYLSQKAV
jgi:hypothetical protein